jgi:predicted HAD superfamily Cof-like phosphohydrolase
VTMATTKDGIGCGHARAGSTCAMCTAKSLMAAAQAHLNGAVGWAAIAARELFRPDYDKVGDFHEKFGLDNATHRHGRPAGMDPDAVEFRLRFLLEELGELCEGYGMKLDWVLGGTPAAAPDQDLAQIADALVDLSYVALGTGHLHSMPWAAMFDEVHRANMSKERATSVDDPRSTRRSALNVVKPAGFQPPDVGRVLQEHGWEPKPTP